MALSPVLYLASILVIVRSIYALYLYMNSPLRSIPGPFLARFTRLWYFYRVYKGHFEEDNIALHRRYGPIFRYAPNHYSLDSPTAIKTVYGHGTKFGKSDWYQSWRHPDPNRFTMFTDQDIRRHAEQRRKYQSTYSMSSLVSYESYVEDCAEVFARRLNEFAENGEVVDMARWLQFYAFDVIGEITYSKRFGFLEKGNDVAGVMQAVHNKTVYGTLIGIFAEWHPFAFKVMNLVARVGPAGDDYLVKYGLGRIKERTEERKRLNDEEKKVEREGPEDFLGKFLRAKERDEKFTEYNVLVGCMVNIIAGSDTTSISLSSILYNLMKRPLAMQRLREEIEELERAGKISDPITFNESLNVPYLQAVMKEALRMHPATGLPLERVVPPGGAEICGKFFPVGAVVGINTWVAHRNPDVFGSDADQFRPERWLVDNEKKLKAMEAYYMPFGLGSRTCIGQHISKLEMSKLVPQLVRRFDFELENPEEQWSTSNSWFVKTSFRCRIMSRIKR